MLTVHFAVNLPQGSVVSEFEVARRLRELRASFALDLGLGNLEALNIRNRSQSPGLVCYGRRLVPTLMMRQRQRLSRLNLGLTKLSVA